MSLETLKQTAAEGVYVTTIATQDFQTLIAIAVVAEKLCAEHSPIWDTLTEPSLGEFRPLLAHLDTQPKKG